MAKLFAKKNAKKSKRPLLRGVCFILWLSYGHLMVLVSAYICLPVAE